MYLYTCSCRLEEENASNRPICCTEYGAVLQDGTVTFE